MKSSLLGALMLIACLVPHDCLSADRSNNLSAAVDARGRRYQGKEYQGIPPWWREAIHGVRIYYPMSTRILHTTGSGLFRLSLDLKTGTVNKFTILRSTGSRSLDYAATDCFRYWRWKPNSWREIDVPVTFTLTAPR